MSRTPPTTPPSRARARTAEPPVATQAELDFATAVTELSALLLAETRRLVTAAAERPLTFQEGRQVQNLANAAKAIGSGTLWGARAILQRQQKSADGPNRAGKG